VFSEGKVRPAATEPDWGDVSDREPRRKQSGSGRPRICVVDSKEVGLAYARLDECRVDVMGSLPSLTQLSPKVAAAYDAILVGCSERLLLSPAFRARAHQLSRTARLVAVIPSPTSNVGAQAAGLGFAGLVSREVTPRALERTIAAAIQGESAFPRSVLNGLVQMMSRFSTTRSGAAGAAALTPRQEQIVELIAQGATDREIALLLRISESTAHKHVQNALRRFNAKTRSQLVASARQPVFPGSFGP
jgi:DNA-binding NarL/FixJ family response regulator